MNSVTQASADWRVLFSAALIGSGVGLGLGAAYMAGGLGQPALQYTQAASASDVMLQRDSGAAPGALRLANATAEQPLSKALADKPIKRRGGYSSELECLSEAVYYEARGETFQGQAAVAQVVMNRVKHPAFPKTVCAVVFQGSNRRTGCQFSFACDGSMKARREAKAWSRARKIAARTLAGAVLADVGSATHFHTTGVAPAWGPQMRRVGQVGLHVFYRFNPRRKPVPALQAAPDTLLASLNTADGDGPKDIRLTSAVIETAPAAADAAAPASDAKPADAAKPAAKAEEIVPPAPQSVSVTATAS